MLSKQNILRVYCPITLEILPKIRFSSMAKMYRYHQIDGMVATGDVGTVY